MTTATDTPTQTATQVATQTARNAPAAPAQPAQIEPTAQPERTAPTASELITAEVTSWPDITAAQGSRGEYGFKYHGREIGHLHGNRVAHFFFAKPVWAELHAAGRILHHPVFPDRIGPAAREISTQDDVREVIALMRLNYDRAEERRSAGLRQG
jgi:hypothetical protein